MSEFNLLIDGKMVPGDLQMPVLNPATEEVLAQCPRASKAQLDAAVAAAKAAFPAWAATPIAERRKLVTKMADVIEANADELARLLTSEQGKPLADATGEVMGMAALLPLSQLARPADEGDRGQRRPPRRGPSPSARRRRRDHAVELSAADPQLQDCRRRLLAGNTMVVKPAPTTPLATLRFAELVKDILPPGRAQRHHRRQRSRRRDDQASGHPQDLVHRLDRDRQEGDGQRGRDAEAHHAGTRRQRRRHRARRRRSEEGRARHLRRRVPELRAGLPRHQAALCPRVGLRRNLRRTGGASPRTPWSTTASKQGTKLGPLQNKMQYEKVKGFLEDARKNGNIIAGGAAMDRPGYFIEPTIVRDIKEGSRLVDEEQFGPVLPVIKYSDNDDVIRRANATTYGLGGSVWSSDTKRAPQGRRARSRPARSGSTSTSTWRRTSRSAAPSSPASAPNSPRKVSPSSPSCRSSTKHANLPTRPSRLRAAMVTGEFGFAHAISSTRRRDAARHQEFGRAASDESPRRRHLMFDSQCDLAALVYEPDEDPDRILRDFASDLNRRGYRAVGLVQLGHDRPDTQQLSALLVHTGEKLSLFHDLAQLGQGMPDGRRPAAAGRRPDRRARSTRAPISSSSTGSDSRSARARVLPI